MFLIFIQMSYIDISVSDFRFWPVIRVKRVNNKNKLEIATPGIKNQKNHRVNIQVDSSAGPARSLEQQSIIQLLQTPGWVTQSTRLNSGAWSSHSDLCLMSPFSRVRSHVSCLTLSKTPQEHTKITRPIC